MFKSRLIEKLKNKEYRKHFVGAQVRRLVTAQIKALRDRNRWTQEELGQRAGMKANAISRLENPDYGDFTINTLLRIAEAFDVALVVRFASHGEVVAWNRGITPSAYTPPDFSAYLQQSEQLVARINQSFHRPIIIPTPVPCPEDPSQFNVTFKSTGERYLATPPQIATSESGAYAN